MTAGSPPPKPSVVLPASVAWHIKDGARELVGELKERFGEDGYEAQKTAFKAFLCNYFSAVACDSKQGDSISPVGVTAKRGKKLKVRWSIPGGGKSGGLRVAVVAYCEALSVSLVGGWLRRDVDAATFDGSFDGH